MRVALGIEYDGTAYVGWQRQKSGTGVQEIVEAAIAKVADQEIQTTCAGRTDAGVHASGQVVHFDSSAQRSDRNWLLGVNSALPDDINAAWARAVDDKFHARFSATSRTYRYLILNRLARSALHSRRAWWVYDELDATSMQQGADHLIGRHDFSAFRAAGCQAASALREITLLRVDRLGDWLILTVTANAFLQHMVRNIAGTLVAVGKGERPPEWARELLHRGDRKVAGITAPPQGLTLIGVVYPPKSGIPAHQEQGLLIS